MRGIDGAEHNAIGIAAQRREPPRLDAQRGGRVHFLSTGLESSGLVVWSACHLSPRLHDWLRKRASGRATAQRGQGNTRDQAANHTSHEDLLLKILFPAWDACKRP